MSNKNKKKQQAARASTAHKPAASIKSNNTKAGGKPATLPLTPSLSLSTDEDNDVDDDDDDEIPPEDLQITIEVLTRLNASPNLLLKKQYKPLKRIGWDFSKTLSNLGSGSGSSTQSQISHLLSLSLYRPALVLLFDLYTSGQPTKLGSLQRWVRECDATARPDEVLTPDEKEERRMVLRCLDMVLRVCGSSSISKGGAKSIKWEEAETVHREANANAEEEEEEQYGEGIIKRMKPWDARLDPRVFDQDGKGKIGEEVGMWDLIQRGWEDSQIKTSTDPSSTSPPKIEGFYPIQTTPGNLRRPPNMFPSTVWASTSSSPIRFPSPSTISSAPPSSPPTFSLTHPTIPTLSIILNVLPPTLCQTIISTCNDLGWEADQAIGGSAVEKSSVLAHNVVWLADEGFVGELMSRIGPFVESQLGAGVGKGTEEGVGMGKREKGDGKGGRVRGINRRFRVYRYGAKQVYRPHIDGAWPAAGIDPESGEYLHDSSPPHDPLWSRYTLLIYLNSDINPSPTAPSIPGATTFFLPSPSSIGTLASFPISPIQGAVLVFPHGDARGSLLHEGSPVGEGGWKVVIRTDLLYEAEGFGEFAPGKKEKDGQGSGQGKGTKRKLVVEEDGGSSGGDGGDGFGAPSKIVKIVQGGKTVGEALVPRSVAGRNGGDGMEGIGG